MNRISLSVTQRTFTLLVLLFGLIPGIAQAQTLYGVTYSSQELITINKTTGAGTLVAPVAGVTTCGGLSFRGAKMYLMDITGGSIKEVDRTTGATLNTINIGPYAYGDGDIAFHSNGIGFICAFAPAPLTRFDITVPNSTAIGPLSPNVTLDALAFNAADVLYGISQGSGTGADTSTQLYTVNQTTGVMTLIGPTGLTATGVGGMAFDSAGNLFAALGDGSGPTSFYQINRA